MEEIAKQLMEIAAPAIVAIAGALATWAVAEFRRFVSAKVQNQEARAAMKRIADLAETTVAEINQKIRSSGQLPKEERRRLLTLAFKQIMAQLTPKMAEAARATTGDLTRLIVAKIEAEVYKQKVLSRPRSGAPVGVAGGGGADGGK